MRPVLRPALRACVLALLFAACAPPPPAAPAPTTTATAGHGHPGHAAHAGHAAPTADDEALEAVRRAHGGAGPWAVSGFRMGRYALAKLGLPRGSFDLDVTHEGPSEVQYSCVADGAAAATGASLGKLNLRLATATREQVKTIYQKKSTGQRVVLRPTAAFVARFADVPRERLGEAGREVLALPDAEVFEEVR